MILLYVLAAIIIGGLLALIWDILFREDGQ